MGDSGKKEPCEDRRRLTRSEIFWRTASVTVPIVLFIILYFIKIPATTAAEKMERHEIRITALETEFKRLETVEKQVAAIYNHLLGNKP